MGMLRRAILVLGILVMGCTNKSTPSKPLVVQVTLDGPVDSIEGWSWPKDSDGSFMEIAAIEDPSELTMLLPSGCKVTMTAKSVFFYAEKDLIDGIHITPMPELADFSGALKEAKRIGTLLRVDEDRRFKNALMRWEADPPGPSSKQVDTGPTKVYADGFPLEDKVDLRLEIKQHVSRRGWFLVVELSAYHGGPRPGD